MAGRRGSQTRRDFIKVSTAAGGAAMMGGLKPVHGQPSAATGGTYDFIVTGGGHNGLVCAAYLAKAGYSVVVLEAKDKAGGNTSTEHLTGDETIHEPCANSPGGFMHSPAYHELNLVEYGVEFAEQDDLFHVTQFPDGEFLPMWSDPKRTAEEIARFSTRDARAYGRLLQDTMSIMPEFGNWEETPIGHGPSLPEIMRKRKDGATWMRRMQQTAIQSVDEYFREPHIRAWAASWASTARQPLDDYGTGFNLVYLLGRQRSGWTTMVGGCGAIPDGLVRLLAEHDCPVLTNKYVVELLVDNGTCVGVSTADGDVYRATKGVISSAAVQQLLTMAPEGSLPDDFVANLTQWKPCTVAMFDADYRVKEPPMYNVHGELRSCVVGSVTHPVDVQRRTLEVARRGEIPQQLPHTFIVTPSVIDKTRAPMGGHTVKVLALYPYDLKDGGPGKWDEIKHEIAERHLEQLRPYVVNLESSNIKATYVQSPLDIAGRNINNIGGTCHGGGETLPQMGEMRPVFGWAGHRMPIKGLYLTGAGTHPGGSVTGIPGRNAAWVVLEDQGKSIEDALA